MSLNVPGSHHSSQIEDSACLTKLPWLAPAHSPPRPLSSASGPAFSHTIVGNRVFPATLAIDDPGVNDELGLPMFAYIANPDNSNEFDFNFAYQKTITYDLSFSIADTFTHLTNALRADGTLGTINGWKNLRTQLKYVPYQNRRA